MEMRLRLSLYLSYIRLFAVSFRWVPNANDGARTWNNAHMLTGNAARGPRARARAARTPSRRSAVNHEIVSPSTVLNLQSTHCTNYTNEAPSGSAFISRPSDPLARIARPLQSSPTSFVTDVVPFRALQRRASLVKVTVAQSIRRE